MSEKIATTQEWFETHLIGEYDDPRKEQAKFTLDELEQRETRVAQYAFEQSRLAVALLFKELAEELTS